MPTWFPYLEYALLSLASLTGVMAMGCICMKCCRAFGIIRDDDDDDDEDRDEKDFRRYKRDSIYPLDTPKPPSNKKRNGLDF